MIYDVVVIGGGIVGCAIARELTRFRLAVALCDKQAEVGFGTTKANSGIIHGGHHSNPDSLRGRHEWEGNQRWEVLRDELGFGFARVGERTLTATTDCARPGHRRAEGHERDGNLAQQHLCMWQRGTHT
jgi:glycerol-3-phosphate dehydrogenase